MNTDVHTLVSAVALSLVHSLWEVALLGLLAALNFGAMGRAGAAQRHTAGMAWLLAMAAAPVVTFFLHCRPGAPVDGLAALPVLASAFHTPPADSPASLLDWATALITLLWLAGVAAMLVVRIGGWQMVRGLDGQSWERLPPLWQARLEALRQALAISRSVGVRLGRQVGTPFTAYVLKPVIYLPLGLLSQLPRDQVEALLAHELAHIRRLDWLWNLAQTAIEAVLFFHPAMWWLSGRIRQEREHACDAMAASVCGGPIALAEALAALQRARPSFAPGGLVLAAAGGVLGRRIRHLLSGGAQMRNSRAMWALLLLCCVCLIPGAAMRGPLNLLVNLHVDGTTRGPLGPGDYREFAASYLFGKARYYRISVDAHGAVNEVFREEGVDRPIDAGVRDWLRAMTAMHEPARSTPSDMMVNLLGSIKADPRVTAVTGTPVAVVDGSRHGTLHVSSLPGVQLWAIGRVFGSEASGVVTLAGPKGRAQVSYEGEALVDRWQLSSMSVAPLPR
jgi:beta-lactamase regulating signal transducer with metallopeptidase domain